MASFHTIPQDILEHIAWLLATETLTEPPRDLVSFLLTDSRIHGALNVRSCPHLYANIFRSTFDFDHDLHGHLTDSSLAVELYRRYRVLWRTRRQDFSCEPTSDELKAAIRMVLEDAGRNAKHLAASGISTFIMTYVSRVLVRSATTPADYSVDMMWLLILTVTHQNIIDTPQVIREELGKSLHFPTSPIQKHDPEPDEAFKIPQTVYFPDFDDVALLEKAIPGIILTFALNEATPIAIPPHIPETRAIAIASRRTGPTQEDFRGIAYGRTPLFAEMEGARAAGTNPAAYISVAAHEVAYRDKLRPFLHCGYCGSSPICGYIYVPGSLSGLWDGSFMKARILKQRIIQISGVPPPSDSHSPAILGNFNCLKPMQCAITEYMCFSPNLLIPLDASIDFLQSAVKCPRSGYERYRPGPNGTSTQRDPGEALDIIILGKASLNLSFMFCDTHLDRLCMNTSKRGMALGSQGVFGRTG
ncbi:hypothetical protein H0H81_012354 [Sphagnurus paluster]|uniref:F-box domain-containing protein n=1 Tax=Sphagnurus paluster TaxID=117069 RepID=A0A9P7GU99_9AGAR|nr:hypothetical protein H0H81_012354 [Sphagnurus paluster]